MLVPYPSVARTLEIGIGALIPQSVLSSPYRGGTDVFRLGDQRWRGEAQITTDVTNPAAIAAMVDWAARMADFGNWTELPLVDRAMTKWAGASLTVTAVNGGTITATGTPDAQTRNSTWVHDGKRLRLIMGAVGSTFKVTPAAPLVASGATLKEVTTIEAHLLPDDAGGPLQVYTPDWVQPVTIAWVERISG